ncbi:hypothetical protein CUJ83_06455 [Methanocella sp. CWC-04]|uniref:Uncharacterized protein n=1 Tax=Methanooceanicella nereidis TaxID=2052831 RepID=A0AAP2REM4_9EURY|nr:hypothetical protein [Methanocella sp. CWC-04]MCD1294640.1 hypothetical protein [Methanocella sp. CWC-04]
MSDLTRLFSRLIAILLTFLTVASIAAPLSAAQVTRPHAVYGYVTVDGIPASGVTVSGDGITVTTLDNGYYQINVFEGITMKVVAAYEGYTAGSDTFTTSGDRTQKDLGIVTSGWSSTHISASIDNSPGTITAIPTVMGTTTSSPGPASQGTGSITPSPGSSPAWTKTENTGLYMVSGVLILMLGGILAFWSFRKNK